VGRKDVRFRDSKADELLASENVRHDPSLELVGPEVQDGREADDLWKGMSTNGLEEMK
jgi:hypothetical protein